ncbi:MAG: amidohydrolase family protein [Clostridia bacterium]|nr:amidohydrolase family protein [Clostridia bacterium]
MLYVVNGRIVAENEIFDGFIGIENGIIAEMAPGFPAFMPEESIDAEGRLVVPGFIDIHCHGGGGRLFSQDPGVALRAHRTRGTLGILPTIGYNMTMPEFLLAVSGIASMEENEILGINCEGPFINQEYGADTRYASDIEQGIYEDIYSAGKGRIRIWTFSPELEGADEFKAFLASKEEIIPCAGHTGCKADKLGGIRLVCHLFDAMGPKSRECAAIHENGTAEAVLADGNLYAEIIADSNGVHVPRELLVIAYKIMGDRLILISDAVSTPEAGVEGDLNYNEAGELSGSLLSVGRAVANMKRHTGIGWSGAVRMGSLNPARLLGIDSKTGSIKPGKKADIVIMDEEANVYEVISGGRRITDEKG